jgi:predicted  nucleic acid-binding Zn-ribbon protein
VEKIKEFIAENRLVLVVGLCLLLLICWLHHDANRNKPVYNDTDKSMERIEERMSNIESRLDTMSDRLKETQKTVERVGIGISRSTGYAIEIDEGIGRTEIRLDNAVKRSERIQNLISDIEKSDRERTKNP